MTDLHRIAATAARLVGQASHPDATPHSQLFLGMAEVMAATFRDSRLIEACASRAQSLADGHPSQTPARTYATPHSAPQGQETQTATARDAELAALVAQLLPTV